MWCAETIQNRVAEGFYRRHVGYIAVRPAYPARIASLTAQFFSGFRTGIVIPVGDRDVHARCHETPGAFQAQPLHRL